MNVKNKATMMGLLALAMMDPVTSKRMPEPEINAGGGDTEIERYRKSKGIQEFTIDGITVHARDYKNALRKVNNLRK